MDFFFKGMNGDESDCPFDVRDIQRCPFLRNIDEPTNFSFSPTKISIPVLGATGPIFEDGPSFDMAFKLFHGKDGVVPLSERSYFHSANKEADSMPVFNPLAGKAAAISLSSFGLGGPFNFGNFSEKRKKPKNYESSNKKEPSSQKGDISKHEALGNEWLTKGNCPIAKSYRAVGRVLPLVATALKPPTAMKFKCPAAVVAARAALARTTFVKNLRPQPLPAKVLAIAALGMALNVPLGMWKEHTKKFSLSWFAAVHAAVPFIAMLRKSVLMPKSAMVLTIAASILGQVIGSRAERIRMKAIAEMGKVTTLTETTSSVPIYNSRQLDNIRTSRCGAEGMVLNPIPVKDAEMEEDVGRTRLGRETRAHASARQANPPRPKRGRRRQEAVPFIGTHDHEAGGSSTGGSRRRSIPSQDQEAGLEVQEDAPELQEDAELPSDRDEDDDVGQPQPQEVPEQGYGGGPSDTSLLHAYHKHRANTIWEARNFSDEVLKKVMRSIANGKKVINLPKLPRNQDSSWFWDVITATGLEPLTRTNYSIIDHGLMTAFAERWHPETNTFHLPIGEAGITLDDITLDDVQCLLHLPITGPLLTHERLRKEEGVELVCRNLGVDEGDVRRIFKETNGCHYKYHELQTVYVQNKEVAVAAANAGRPMEEIIVLRERCIKAFLLFLVCCTIFSNKSQNYVDVVYLQYFEDLNEVHNCNWGAAALVYLQNYMEASTKWRCGQMAGYMSFLQGWVLSHFPRLNVWRADENYNETMPRCAKFVPGQGHRDPASYREHLDNMQMSDFVYTPYTDHRHVRPLIDVCWFSG